MPAVHIDISIGIGIGIGIGEGRSLTTGVIDLSEMDPRLFHLSGQGSVSHRVAGEGARDGVR